MSMCSCFTVILVAAMVCFAASIAAPSVHMNVVPVNSVSAVIAEDSVPDPGIGNWFSSIFDILAKNISKRITDGDPKKIEEVRKYIKNSRAFITPVSTFLKKYYPNDTTVNNIMGAINAFLSRLEGEVDGKAAERKAAIQFLASYMMNILETA